MNDPQSRIDPEFTALPLRELADAALTQARSLGAQHADFRAERIRGQQIGLSDGNPQTLFDADDTGLAVRVIVDGTWGFASAVDLSSDGAAQAARQAVEVAHVAAAMNTEPIELAPEPGYGEVSWVSAYDVDPFTISVADKVALLAQWSRELLAHPAVSHVDASLQQVRECKFYSDGATTATQQRVRLHPQITATAIAGDGRFDTMRTLAPPAGRGYEFLGGHGWDFAAELAELPELLAAKLAAPSVEPGRYDLVIDPSNLWLTIHESIGHATELDRALGYEAAYAGTSFATPDKLGHLQYGSGVMHVTGDRTAEHGLATVGYDDEGVAAQSWDLISDGILAGYQLDRRMAQLQGFGRSNGCAFSDGPGHMPMQRMANVSLQPAARRTVHRRAHRRGGTRDLHPGRQELVDRHAAVQLPVHRPAVLQDRERAAGRAAARRGLSGHHDRLLGLDGSRRRPADLRARRRVQLRQGPARPGRPGQPRLPGRPAARRPDSQHRGRGSNMSATTGISPAETVERALEAARSDDCIVIAEETSAANLRWAGNTLTTNGVSGSRQLTVIAIDRRGDGAAPGIVSRAGVRPDQIEDVVREAEHAAAEATPADDAGELIGADRSSFGINDGEPGWDSPPGHTEIGVLRDFAAALGQALRAAEAADRKLYGFAEHELTSTFLGTSTGLRRRYDQPTGRVELNAKSADMARSAWTGVATRDFTDVDIAGLDAGLTERLGWAERAVPLPAGRYETLLPPTAVSDLLTYLYWSAGAKEAAEGRTVFSQPGGGTRIGERLSPMPVTLSSDPRAPGLACAPFVIAHASGPDSSVFDNGLPLHATSWIRDGSLAALVSSRHSAAVAGVPVTPAIDNLTFATSAAEAPTLEQMIASTGRGLLLTCLWYIREVDPQTLLLTGLTRDGVYLVENGEVVGAVNNFRFNESPVGMLGRLLEVGATVPTLPREWGDYFNRAAMPPVRVEGFNMSSVSQAS